MTTYKVLIAHDMSQHPLHSTHPDVIVEDLSDTKGNKYDIVMNKIGDYDALLSVFLNVDRPLLDRASQLKIVANYGVGYDNVDVAYAQKKGISVSNTPESTTIVTANYTLGLLLALLRKIVTNDGRIRKKNIIPAWGHPMTLGTPIPGKTLGIIGMGRIGSAVARRARAFDLQICYHNRNRLAPQTEEELDARYLSLDELLSTSDIVTLHTPLTPETRGFIDRAAFAKMKPGAFFINTARGTVVDQEALIEALESGQLAGAALDVFAEEPTVPEVLLTMDQVILSPHNGSGTKAARHQMFEEALGNIIAYLTGGKMTSRVV